MNWTPACSPVHTYELGITLLHGFPAGLDSGPCRSFIRAGHTHEGDFADFWRFCSNSGAVLMRRRGLQFIRMNQPLAPQARSHKPIIQLAPGSRLAPLTNPIGTCVVGLVSKAPPFGIKISCCYSPVHTYELRSLLTPAITDHSGDRFIRMNYSHGGYSRTTYDLKVFWLGVKREVDEIPPDLCKELGCINTAFRFAFGNSFPFQGCESLSAQASALSVMAGSVGWFIRMNQAFGGHSTSVALVVHTYELTHRPRRRHLPPVIALDTTEPRHRAGFGVSGVPILEIQPMT